MTFVEVAKLSFAAKPGALSPYDRESLAAWLRRTAQRLDDGELNDHGEIGLTRAQAVAGGQSCPP